MHESSSNSIIRTDCAENHASFEAWTYMNLNTFLVISTHELVFWTNEIFEALVYCYRIAIGSALLHPNPTTTAYLWEEETFSDRVLTNFEETSRLA